MEITTEWKRVEKELPALNVPKNAYGMSWKESAPVFIYFVTKNDSDFPYGIARYTSDGWVGISFDGLTNLSDYEILYWRYLDYVY